MSERSERTVSTVRPYGSHAWLIQPPDGVTPADLAAAVVARPVLTGVIDVVPGAETVLVVVDDPPADAADRLAEFTVERSDGAGVHARTAPITIDVVYDGDDLEAVAKAAGWSVGDVIARHTGAEYWCEFCGFAPGFAYLGGLDGALELPRRATPRSSVAAGSVAIAGPYSAVYPSASPGGWHVLGRTDAVLWDPDAESPALITPGRRVHFRAVKRLAGRPGQRPARPTGAERPSARSAAPGLRVIAAPWPATLQDRGRAGSAALGVPPSGALDAERRNLVNRLVGNAADAAVIETAGGLDLEATGAVMMADSTTGAAITLGAGGRLSADPRRGEVWAYVAVRGGFLAPPVLGSRSRDTLSGLGPPALRTGDLVAVGSDPGTAIATDLAPPAERTGPTTLRVRPGPRRDWFVDGAYDELLGGVWSVSNDVSRVGVRLLGPGLARRPQRAGTELASEGLVTGAVQVPPDGRPVILLNDHPTTGGYPVIAVVDRRDLGAAAQAAPGTTVRLVDVTGPPLGAPVA